MPLDFVLSCLTGCRYGGTDRDNQSLKTDGVHTDGSVITLNV